MTAIRPKTSLPCWMWLLAVGLMLAEFLLFDAMTSRYHASVYPRWNDQIQYLMEAYTAHDQAQAHGLLAGVKFALGKDAVQGTLHDTAAVVVFAIVGSASRSAALSLNMLVFLAWQAALLLALTRVSGSRALAWMGFGLVLALAGPWSVVPGSAIDFRLDHGAMCLFGVTACVALLTRGFRSIGWSIGLGFAVSLAILERFLTVAYFVPLFVVVAFWLLFTPDRWLRLRNLLLAGAIVSMTAIPVLWINRTGILNYYWVGHITSAESAARLRGFDLAHSVGFILQHLWQIHLGVWFGSMAAAFTGLLLLLALFLRRKSAAGLSPDWLFLGLVFLLVPALVLVFHRQKSEYVLNILLPGLILLLVWAWSLLWIRIDFSRLKVWSQILPALLAAAAVAVGGAHFARRQLPMPYPVEFAQDARTVNRLTDYIYRTSHAARLATPNIGIDRIVDFMDGRILRVICYEQYQEWISFGVHLPDSILESPDEVVFFKLKYCDFVLLTDEMPDQGYWPYDRQMQRLYPQLKAWCEENLRRVETFTAFGRKMSFYQRKDLP